jgi:hypothetical protein
MKTPFVISPSPTMLYLTPSFKKATHTITATLDNRQGISCIIGDIGMGKSSLLRYLHAEYLSRDECVAVLIRGGSPSFHSACSTSCSPSECPCWTCSARRMYGFGFSFSRGGAVSGAVEGKSYRLITVGRRTLSHLCGLNPKTCKLKPEVTSGQAGDRTGDQPFAHLSDDLPGLWLCRHTETAGGRRDDSRAEEPGCALHTPQNGYSGGRFAAATWGSFTPTPGGLSPPGTRGSSTLTPWGSFTYW